MGCGFCREKAVFGISSPRLASHKRCHSFIGDFLEKERYVLGFFTNPWFMMISPKIKSTDFQMSNMRTVFGQGPNDYHAATSVRQGIGGEAA
jgi:hypothetical protein